MRPRDKELLEKYRDFFLIDLSHTSWPESVVRMKHFAESKSFRNTEDSLQNFEFEKFLFEK